MTDKVQKIKDWISKEQDGLMDAQGNFEYPEHEGAYHILCNLDTYIDSLQEEPKKCMYSKDHYTDNDRKVLCDGCEEKCEYNKKQPSIPDIVDEHFDEILGYIPPDANIIQYASREEGIKANAEEYSYNIESELFQQLSKEQQKLWRKEIEQACISGGYYGLNIANDKRYDKEEPVSEDLEKASIKYAQDKYMPVQTSQAFKAGAKWQKQKDQAIIELAEDHAMLAGMEKMKEEMMAKAVDGDITFDYYDDGDKIYGCIAHDSFCLEDFGLKDRDKVKVIVIKED